MIEPHREYWVSIIFVLFSSLSSVIVMAVIYPDLLIYRSLSFNNFHDQAIPFHNSFTLISHYYHGGIQLWNQYDQMSYIFGHLGSGFYQLANIITALAYILLSPFFYYEAELFHSIHSIVFYASATLIRTVGGYLLLRKFSRSPLVVFVGLIYFNTLLSSQMWMGYNTNNLYGYFPLLIYFILRFFENYRLRDFLMAFVVMTIAVATSPLQALSYFYLAVHFFIISCILGAILKMDIGNIKKLILSIKEGLNHNNLIKAFFAIGVGTIIILPSLFMADSLNNDFFIPGSGLGETSGRFDNIFSIQNYFSNKTFFVADPKSFLIKSVDYWNNDWEYDWMFLGISSIIFSIIGVLFSRDKRKHIFLWTIILILLCNVLSQGQASIISIGHWLNVLTNPFSFLVRSFHMSALLMPYLLPPLIVLGLQSCSAIINKKLESIYTNRVILGIVSIITILVYFSFSLGVYPMVYVLLTGILFLMGFYLLWENNLFKRTLVGSIIYQHRVIVLYLLFAFALFCDMGALSVYIKNNKHLVDIMEHIIKDKNGNSHSGVVDYQNPKVFPFREYLRPEPIPISLRGINYQLTNYGLYYRYTHVEKYFDTPSLYKPRHISYKGMNYDTEIKQYLVDNNRLLFFADYAVLNSNISFSDIANAKLSKHVILVDSHKDNNPRILTKLPKLDTIEKEHLPLRLSEFSFSFENATKRSRLKSNEYIFNLPDTFPSYISTGLFTDDINNISLTLGVRELKPVQGKLKDPFTYDIQNVSHGKLTILLPKVLNVVDDLLVLKHRESMDIIDIWRNEHDNLGITLFSQNDGWLVFHYPYDEKWRLTIDGNIAQVHRVNKYFIGTPIQNGEHNILLQYWPDTWLREMILISIILSALTFVGLFILSIRTENMIMF